MGGDPIPYLNEGDRVFNGEEADRAVRRGSPDRLRFIFDSLFLFLVLLTVSSFHYH